MSILNYNERNCILFRSGEKRILHFLKDNAARFLKLMTMNQKVVPILTIQLKLMMGTTMRRF